MKRLDLSKEIEEDELTALIFRVLAEESELEYIPLQTKVNLGRELFNIFRKLDVLQDFVEDDEITEIMINGTQNIFVEKRGKLYLTDKKFSSRSRLEDVIQQIVSGANRMVNEASPIVDARLPDGSRVNVVLYPVAVNGPIVTIRKFPKEQITMNDLIRLDALDEELAEFLKMLVKSGYNIFISGGTGSGKTTLLNALSQFIPEDERIITIEDNAELQIQGLRNLVRLESRNPNTEGSGEITIRSLIRTALRMRPDRIIVGEVRGTETIDMIQAMSTGHKGSLSTGHSDSPQDMLQRLETMILMGMDIPLEAVQRQIASAIDVIIHIGRLRDKSRKILEVVEVLNYENSQIKTQTLYEFEENEGQKSGEEVRGSWKKAAGLCHREKLLSAGYQEAGIRDGI